MYLPVTSFLKNTANASVFVVIRCLYSLKQLHITCSIIVNKIWKHLNPFNSFKMILIKKNHGFVCKDENDINITASQRK